MTPQTPSLAERTVTLSNALTGMIVSLILIFGGIFGIYVRNELTNAHQDWVDEQRQKTVERIQSDADTFKAAISELRGDAREIKTDLKWLVEQQKDRGKR